MAGRVEQGRQDRLRDDAESILAAVFDAADPSKAVARAWPGEVDHPGLIVLLAAGKASVAMTLAAAERCRDRVRLGAVACVPEHEPRLRAGLEALGLSRVVHVRPADHPLAASRNLDAARVLAETADAADTDDLVLGLISGGASAHLIAPAPGITLDDLRSLTDATLRSGATIRELNAIRKHSETLKGGGLARRCAPARVLALVLSDVLGDPLDTIGSGPLAPDPTTFADALAAIERRGLGGVAPAIVERLRKAPEETPKPGDPLFDRVEHRVIANNRLAVEAAAARCAELGYPVVDRRFEIDGEAADVGRALARRLLDAPTGPAAVIWGGETTVRVGDAPGKGGRNTEAALAAAIELDGATAASALALATDGVDGPTDAAGGVVTGTTAGAIREKNLDLAGLLRTHDSYTALDAVGCLLRTGPSGTNINDVLVGLKRR